MSESSSSEFLFINLVKEAASTVLQLDNAIISNIIYLMKSCLCRLFSLMITHIEHVGMIDTN